MSYKTLEVTLDNGRVLPCGPEMLPANAHALLTLLDSSAPPAARTCGELAERWGGLDRLPSDEGCAFADDLAQARASLPPMKSAWD
ncbi:MAG: hypothetical protein HZA89_05665 [Verrucomicrobia bacterium]|nr:hypothetical protein [Verrucomicrobiota bacterium]